MADRTPGFVSDEYLQRKNVFLGIQESELAYRQGTGNTLLTPAPWADSALLNDPDWSWCSASDVMVSPISPTLPTYSPHSLNN